MDFAITQCTLWTLIKLFKELLIFQNEELWRKLNLKEDELLRMQEKMRQFEQDLSDVSLSMFVDLIKSEEK